MCMQAAREKKLGWAANADEAFGIHNGKEQ